MKKPKIFITLLFLSFFGLMFSSCETLNIFKPNNKPSSPDVEKSTTQNQKTEEDSEYLRSTNSLDSTQTVSKAEFEEDKKQILQIIEELSLIMETKNVDAWLNYIEPQSKAYYSKPVNLKKAQKRLPNKMVQLNSIGDYFNFVFIPSRKRSQVDEIRYISRTNIKAVQVRDDNSIVVYYYFNKINNKWMVYLPPISE